MEPNARIVAAVCLFLVAAMLFFQSRRMEGFESNVPADLNKALIATPSTQIAQSGYRPHNVPGAIAGAPPEQVATAKDLQELDQQMSIWVAAATQRSMESPDALTNDQNQQKVQYQARIVAIRRQLGTGMITDTASQVQQELSTLRNENVGWQTTMPNLEAVQVFAKGVPDETHLTADQYSSFMRLFTANLNEMNGHTQPDPLQRVRLQQLQAMQQDLKKAERTSFPPAIQAGAARKYLQTMLKPDQPLPTLFSLNPPGSEQGSWAANPMDVIRQLKDIQWALVARYNPGEQALQKSIAALLDRLQSGSATPQEVATGRVKLVELQNAMAPSGMGRMETDGGSSLTAYDSQPAPAPSPEAPTQTPTPTQQQSQSASGQTMGGGGYDPADVIGHANRMCSQLREAFPDDATALGCPVAAPQSKSDATAIITTVCDRLRSSVPSIAPEQFGCRFYQPTPLVRRR